MIIVVSNATFDQGQPILLYLIHVFPTRGLGQAGQIGFPGGKDRVDASPPPNNLSHVRQTGAKLARRTSHPTPHTTPTPPSLPLKITMGPCSKCSTRHLHKNASHSRQWPHPLSRTCSPPNPPSSPQQARPVSGKLSSAHEMAGPHVSRYGSGYQDIRWHVSSVVWEQMSVLLFPQTPHFPCQLRLPNAQKKNSRLINELNPHSPSWSTANTATSTTAKCTNPSARWHPPAPRPSSGPSVRNR